MKNRLLGVLIATSPAVLCTAFVSPTPLSAQDDPAISFYQEFLAFYQGLPEVPDDPSVCPFMDKGRHVLAAERLFAYLALSGDEDPRLEETLDYLEAVASNRCEAPTASVSGRCDARGNCSAGYAPRSKPSVGTAARGLAGFVSERELEGALTRIRDLESALADAGNAQTRVQQLEDENRSLRQSNASLRQSNATIGQNNAALRQQASAQRQSGAGDPMARSGCWFGTATGAGEMRHGWFCMFEGSVQGPGLGLSGPTGMLVTFEASTGRMSAWMGGVVGGSGPEPEWVGFNGRRPGETMTGSLRIQADGQIRGSLDFANNRRLSYTGGRVR